MAELFSFCTSGKTKPENTESSSAWNDQVLLAVHNFAWSMSFTLTHSYTVCQ